MAKKITSSVSKPKVKSKSKPPETAKTLIRLPNVFKITQAAANLLWSHKKLFVGIAVINGLLNLILVRGLSSPDLASSVGGNSFSSGLNGFLTLVGSTGGASDASQSSYQFVIMVIGSLAIIWALRQVLAGSEIRIRDAYYKGMYPLIPFMLVLIVIGLQLLPLLAGSTLYSLVIANGIAVSLIEKVLWAVLFAGLAAISFYMVISSLFALYISTLPDMTPLKALRSARQLVKRRRWTVLRKVLFLPLLILVLGALIIIPTIVIAAPLAAWIFFALNALGLVAGHAYMYVLYRELINE